MSSQPKIEYSPNHFYFFKKFGFSTDFGKLVQSISDENTRFHVRRFNKTLRENLNILHKVRKPCRMSVSYIKKCLLKILPFQVFASMRNFSKFMKIIAKLCTTTKYECIPLTDLTKHWRLADIKWLPKSDDKEIILRNVLIWIIEWIKVNVLQKLFNIQINKKNNMVMFTPSMFYQSLVDKAVADMENNGKLLTYEGNIDEKKTRTSRLVIVPKEKAFKYRPLVLTDLLKDDKNKIKKICPPGIPFERKLNKAWNTFIKKNKEKKIYGIKMDLKDAFSNVNMDVIKSLLKKYVYGHEPILNALTNQPILCRKTKVYAWNRGLMQGMKASQRLCDLDRAHFDYNNLTPFITKNTFFHRSVDDYFYCSTDENNVERFARILIENCQINENKTERGPKITYMGRVFNIESHQVHFNLGQVETYRNKSKLYYTQYRITDYSKYLYVICSQKCNAFNFNKIFLNLLCNSRETVIMNYFKAMISIAYKVDCAVQVRAQRPPYVLDHFIPSICKFYVRRIRYQLVQSKPMFKPLIISRKVLRVLGYQAFIVVLKQRNVLYKTTINKLEAYVKTYKRHYNKIKPQFKENLPILQNIDKLKLPDDFKNIRMKRILDSHS